MLDYGQAIRDLAYTNIFAGDLLLKNFGVTATARDLLRLRRALPVTDCRFRDVPEATSDEDEMPQAWFYVADNDVFPRPS